MGAKLAKRVLANHLDDDKAKMNLVQGFGYKEGGKADPSNFGKVVEKNFLTVFLPLIISSVISIIIYLAGSASISVIALAVLSAIWCGIGLLLIMGFWGPTFKVIFTITLILYPVVIALGWSTINAKLSNSGLSIGSRSPNPLNKEKNNNNQLIHV